MYEDTLRNSALIGIAQLSGTFRKSGRPFQVVVGEISEPACYQRIARRVRAWQIARRLRSFSIGLIGQVFRGMFDLEFDRGAVRGRLGPEVITIQAEHLVELWQEVPEAEVAAAARELTGRFRTRVVDEGDVQRSVRLGLAMRRLTDRYRLDALCFLGQHYLEKMTHAPARLGASMMMERDRIMVACEGDVGGLIMMQILYELTGRAPVQMEWGQFDTRAQRPVSDRAWNRQPRSGVRREAGHAHPGPGGVGIRRPRRQLGDDPASGSGDHGAFPLDARADGGC